MLSSKHYINVISFSLIGFISLLYLLKFSFIYTEYQLSISLGYLFLYVLTIFSLNYFKLDLTDSASKKLFLSIIPILTLISILYIYLFPRIGEINRLTAIQDWWRLFFEGIFPYNSGLTPSSFPVIFYLAIPFEIAGNLGWLEVMGLAIFLLVSYDTAKSPKSKLTHLILLFATPMIYYEFAVRCELFFNAALALGLIRIAEKYFTFNNFSMKFILWGILFGIVLATRSVVGLIFVIYLLYRFRSNLTRLLQFSAIIFSVFFLLLLPYMIWNFDAFISNGPFAVQAHLSNLPFYSIIILLLISIYAGWSARNFNEVLFSTGIILFATIIISYALKIFEFGFTVAFYYDKIDLSYLVLSLPFLILSIEEYSIDKFLGRPIE